MENEMLRVRIEPTYSTMPEVIARALFGAATTEAVEPEPQFPTGNEPFGFFARPSVIEKTEEQEERELECPLAAKFLSPGVVNKPTPFTLPELPYVNPANFDPEELAINENPTRRFIYDAAARAAGAPSKAEKLVKNTDDEDIPPAAKPITPSEQFAKTIIEIKAAYAAKLLAKQDDSDIDDSADWSPELAALIEEIIGGLDDQGDDEDTVTYDKRIARQLNEALVAQGHRPILSYSGE